MAETNYLYYGDNLDILRRYIKDETVELIYLDPPFNSNQGYNVLFAERDGSRSAAQIQAFEDTWVWSLESEQAYREVVEAGGKPSQAMRAFRQLLGENDMLAYLAMMAPRLLELRRVLKPSGSIYLHCDPTASHYLKILLDAIFGAEHFRNEIAWRRTPSKGLQSRRLARNHDILLSYQKSQAALWNIDAAFIAYDMGNLDEKTTSKYHYQDADGRIYRLADLTNPNPDRPNLTYEFLGVTKVWRWTKDRMQHAYEAGLIVQTRPGTVPQLKRYLDEQRGRPLDDVWTDIDPLNSQAQERLGYPTQKPQALLERIIRLTTNEGDLVLDPFCGCGTAIAAAQYLNRRWIGIDITTIATNLIKNRLRHAYGEEITKSYKVIGEPTKLSEAEALAEQDKFQFQYWALGLVDARPTEPKKGADKGIDGRLFFHDDASGDTKQVIFSVKGGGTSVADVRDLRGVLDREQAQMGVFITLREPTQPMKVEAASAGFYDSPTYGAFPKMQILTVRELLDGKRVAMPPLSQVNVTFKRAPKVRAGVPANTPALWDE